MSAYDFKSKIPDLKFTNNKAKEMFLPRADIHKELCTILNDIDVKIKDGISNSATSVTYIIPEISFLDKLDANRQIMVKKIIYSQVYEKINGAGYNAQYLKDSKPIKFVISGWVDEETFVKHDKLFELLNKK
jgi:hypothetical protein